MGSIPAEVNHQAVMETNMTSTRHSFQRRLHTNQKTHSPQSFAFINAVKQYSKTSEWRKLNEPSKLSAIYNCALHSTKITIWRKFRTFTLIQCNTRQNSVFWTLILLISLLSISKNYDELNITYSGAGKKPGGTQTRRWFQNYMRDAGIVSQSLATYLVDIPITLQEEHVKPSHP